MNLLVEEVIFALGKGYNTLYISAVPIILLHLDNDTIHVTLSIILTYNKSSTI